MAWDSTRTVSWRRLIREWLVYVVVMAVIFLLFLRDTVTVGSVLGLAASLPMYLFFGWFLAKMGYQRKSLTDLRRETALRPHKNRDTSPPPAQMRRRPAPTSRTASGSAQNRSTKRKKR